jgi:hypothetical protein
MHDDLWAGVDLRLRDARNTLDDMRKALRPPPPTKESIILESTGAIVGGPDWQTKFYPLVARFLAEARSIPSIIEASFGYDRSQQMKSWWNSLPPDEQQRRSAFSAQFRTHRSAIDAHPLTTERNIAEHRLGIPEIEGQVVGPFGQIHTATPTSRIMIAEPRPLDPNIANNPGAHWAATLTSQPILPRPEQFTITKAKKPLFPECGAYLVLAEQAVGQARVISQSVHGASNLNTPPS